MILSALKISTINVKLVLSALFFLFPVATCLCAMNIAHAADCFDSHGERHGVPADLLRAIALTESSGNPKAIGQNSSSQDLGLM
ncbi:MAG: transglycosylase SLT domain-containing protein, partial [Burkholderiales bacterium]|nr:transglycosylase SLT domain-containing protein [Burkholderiales bacterium]